jgi:hypothetical protein
VEAEDIPCGVLDGIFVGFGVVGELFLPEMPRLKATTDGIEIMSAGSVDVKAHHTARILRKRREIRGDSIAVRASRSIDNIGPGTTMAPGIAKAGRDEVGGLDLSRAIEVANPSRREESRGVPLNSESLADET